MHITFLGTGEACDPCHGNSSVLVRSGDNCLLLDCGFSVPHAYFAHEDDPEALSGVWISHFHGDHFLGLPLLLLRFWEMGRKTALHLTGQPGLRAKALAALELAYPGFGEKLRYPVLFHELVAEEPRAIAGFLLRSAESEHGQPNLALRLEDSRHALFYSGDGRPTPATTRLAGGCDLAVHEAFRMTDQIQGHGSVEGCLAFAGRAKIHSLALVHLERRFRATEGDAIRRALEKAVLDAVLAEENMTITL